MIKEIQNGIIITIKISPNSSKNEFVENSDCIKLKITAPPVDGKANKAVIEFLSKTFKVPKSYFEIVRGETSKEKSILIKNIDTTKIVEIKSFVNSLNKQVENKN